MTLCSFRGACARGDVRRPLASTERTSIRARRRQGVDVLQERSAQERVSLALHAPERLVSTLRWVDRGGEDSVARAGMVELR